jgi:hypothetical protein
MSKALDTSRKAVGGGGAKGGGRAGRGARQQLDFIVEGMRSGGWCVWEMELESCSRAAAVAVVLIGERGEGVVLFVCVCRCVCGGLKRAVAAIESRWRVTDSTPPNHLPTLPTITPTRHNPPHHQYIPLPSPPFSSHHLQHHHSTHTTRHIRGDAPNLRHRPHRGLRRGGASGEKAAAALLPHGPAAPLRPPLRRAGAQLRVSRRRRRSRWWFMCV